MSEFKGTKGKWELSEVNGELITTDDTNVCKIFAMELNEGKANALLISKAPEMLEVLQRFVKDEEDFEISSLSASLYADEFRELIKQATEL